MSRQGGVVGRHLFDLQHTNNRHAKTEITQHRIAVRPMIDALGLTDLSEADLRTTISMALNDINL